MGRLKTRAGHDTIDYPYPPTQLTTNTHQNQRPRRAGPGGPAGLTLAAARADPQPGGQPGRDRLARACQADSTAVQSQRAWRAGRPSVAACGPARSSRAARARVRDPNPTMTETSTTSFTGRDVRTRCTLGRCSAASRGPRRRMCARARSVVQGVIWLAGREPASVSARTWANWLGHRSESVSPLPRSRRRSSSPLALGSPAACVPAVACVPRSRAPPVACAAPVVCAPQCALRLRGPRGCRLKGSAQPCRRPGEDLIVVRWPRIGHVGEMNRHQIGQRPPRLRRLARAQRDLPWPKAPGSRRVIHGSSAKITARAA